MNFFKKLFSNVKNEPIKAKPNDQMNVSGSINFSMINVESGTFDFGFNPYEGEPFEWSRTIARLSVKSFSISETLVTQKLWHEIMGNTTSGFSGDFNPVESIGWFDAINFCNKLSDIHGLKKCYSGNDSNIQCDFTKNGYRLPTEIEWEYAARGGKSNSKFLYSGSDSKEEIGWFKENSNEMTHPVKEKKPNILGIYDMSGNVWEFCWDKYGETKYLPILRNFDIRTKDYRILRGGSWKDNARMLRVSAEGQSSINPTSKYNDIGFRVCCSII